MNGISEGNVFLNYRSNDDVFKQTDYVLESSIHLYKNLTIIVN